MILGGIALLLGFNFDKHCFSKDAIGFLGFFGMLELISELLFIADLIK